MTVMVAYDASFKRRFKSDAVNALRRVLVHVQVPSLQKVTNGNRNLSETLLSDSD
jgi:hypothetical protein